MDMVHNVGIEHHVRSVEAWNEQGTGFGMGVGDCRSHWRVCGHWIDQIIYSAGCVENDFLPVIGVTTVELVKGDTHWTKVKSQAEETCGV